MTEAQLGFNHGRRIGGGFVNLDLGWQQGIGALGAQGHGHPQAGDPNARYDKYSLTLSYLQPFQLWGERFSFDGLATGQGARTCCSARSASASAATARCAASRTRP
ncbi:ShlB/FhaC/HecB family hemolysin secretion/activation protein [Pseudomonas aeruginosa]|nr:ShlB/FhaC/HecB family hemolysin secretion/activation protein [Pseudomonas aeruginosa]